MMTIRRLLLSILPILLTACAVLTPSTATSSNGVSVSLHGVNYTGESFQYVVGDPKDPSNSGGGEHISPFSAGGTMCCYQLPKRWAPGIQVQVQATHWTEKGPEKKLEEITQVHMVELPRFPDREVAALWVLRTKEGAIELVFSNVQPDHPDWSGRVKGWPEPSLEYRRERWELYRNLAEDSVENNRNLLSGLQAKSQQDLRKSWELHKRYNREEVSEFTGPEDPAFSAYLKKRYVDGLRHSELKLQQIFKAKP
ncbi:hypothetical protein HD842_001845 [Massilia aurea]|jgi:hypothetical protein|uniref:DUF3304 domain-containing protein n=1 Tax=Massilia aurea TaxID=373040 RepID=A0A7W9WZK1_9BURK|nr:DUF3304 domain-containing protein [Massilia aurea]MBB6133734.1 hypothetical protein [Massilia aurea]